MRKSVWITPAEKIELAASLMILTVAGLALYGLARIFEVAFR